MTPPVTGAMTGRYESPCGVMSFVLGFIALHFQRLRIPMRGYETLPRSHIYDALGKLRIPMRGYEVQPTFANGIVLPVTNPHAGL